MFSSLNGGMPRRDRPARIGDRCRLESGIVGNPAMAGVAIEEIEFGEHAFGAARGMEKSDSARSSAIAWPIAQTCTSNWCGPCARR